MIRSGCKSQMIHCTRRYFFQFSKHYSKDINNYGLCEMGFVFMSQRNSIIFKQRVHSVNGELFQFCRLQMYIGKSLMNCVEWQMWGCDGLYSSCIVQS